MADKELCKRLITTNLLPLAFVGDSVHTLFVRHFVLNQSTGKMENYHSQSAKYCKAGTQAKVVKALLPLLNEQEQNIVRRGRNAKPKHQAKNSSSEDYAYATAFEILVGYLYLNDENDRLDWVLNFSVDEKNYSNKEN